MKEGAVSIHPFTSSEAGAWSNSYLISGESDAVLFDVPMLRSDAVKLTEMITESGKTLKKVFISHAHPDHFMGLDVINERFPQAQILSTQNVVADIKTDGPWMLSLVQSKAGPEAANKLVIPEVFNQSMLDLEGTKLEIIEFGECESKHIAALYIPNQKALFSADLVYNNAHLYLQERHIESWLTRLDELENFARNQVSIIHPGHGKATGLELIAQTRAYLHDFADAVKSDNASIVEKQMLSKYPEYHVKQFLTVFSIPAYFVPV